MRREGEKMIVVTGGAGFIGSSLIRHLNSRGVDQLLVVDRLGDDDRWKNLVGKRFADIIDKGELFEWLGGREEEVAAIVHLGACSDTTESDASFLLENNYRYSVRLGEFAAKHGIRFIYASSAATYGDGGKGFCDDHEGLEQLFPLNMYGYSKHLFDLWVKREGLLQNFVGLKYFNVYGPNEWHKGRMASVVYHALPQVLEKGVVRLFKSSDPDHFSDGGQQRDFIYVKDAVRITAAFLENDASGIFNVGRGIPETWNDLARALFHAVGKEPHIEYFDMPKELVGKYQNFTLAEVAKLKGALGEAANCQCLEESVFDYVNNHLLEEKRW